MCFLDGIPSTLRTKCLSFSILLASLWTWRLIWLLFLHGRLILLLPFIIFYLRSSCNQCLVSGRSNDPHLDQLIMLLSDRFNEGVKSVNIPIWSSELHRMKWLYKYWILLQNRSCTEGQLLNNTCLPHWFWSFQSYGCIQRIIPFLAVFWWS